MLKRWELCNRTLGQIGGSWGTPRNHKGKKISIDSPAGRAFKNRGFPHLTDTMHLVEVPILPVYVHTSLCTADHLTRGKRILLGGTPVRIDTNQCIAHFGRKFDDFVTNKSHLRNSLGFLIFLKDEPFIGEI